MSDNGLVWSYKVNGDEISMTNPNDRSYTAKLNGTDAPLKDDPGVTSVSVKMMGKNPLEETDKRNEKIIGVMKMTVASDGKPVKLVYDDKLQKRTNEFEAMKQ